MSASRFFIWMLLSLLFSLPVSGQFKLPKFEIQLKAGVAISGFEDRNDRGYEYHPMIWSGDFIIPLNQNFAIGAFLSRSMSGSKVGVGGNVGTIDGLKKYPALHQTYGAMFRVSTNRLKRFRPYLDARLGKFEMYIDHDTYRLANSTFFYGGTVGLMIKLGARLYFIFPEISVNNRSQSFFFDTRKALVGEVRSGLSINFDKRK